MYSNKPQANNKHVKKFKMVPNAVRLFLQY